MTLAHLAALYAGGLLTFASPCVLPLLPVYVALLGGAGAEGADPSAARARLRRAGIGFAIGLSIVFVLLGMGSSLVAGTLAAHRRGLMIFAGAVMLLFGVKLLGVFRIGALDRDARPLLERVPTPGGFKGGVLFGAAFAVGWTPCVGPVLGAALTYAASSSSSPWVAGGQLSVYALGLATPLVAAAFAADKVVAFARKMRGIAPVSQKVMGVALVGLSFFLFTDRLGALAPRENAVTANVAQPGCAAPGATACSSVVLDAPPSQEAITGKPRLVEFVSGSCTVCARMAPIVEQLAKRCAHDGSLMRVSVDDANGRALASRYGVRVVPTFVSVDAAGGEVDRMVGEQTEERVTRALGEVRGAECPAS